MRNQFRTQLVQISDQPVIGDLEDRCFWVLVDRHDCLGSFIPATWNAPETPGNKSFGATVFPVWPSPIVWNPTGIDHRSTGTDRSAEAVCQVLNRTEVDSLSPPDTPQPRLSHHNLGIAKAWAFADRSGELDKVCLRRRGIKFDG